MTDDNSGHCTTLSLQNIHTQTRHTRTHVPAHINAHTHTLYHIHDSSNHRTHTPPLITLPPSPLPYTSLPAGQPPQAFPQQRMRIAWQSSYSPPSAHWGILLDGLLEPVAEDRLSAAEVGRRAG